MLPSFHIAILASVALDVLISSATEALNCHALRRAVDAPHCCAYCRLMKDRYETIEAATAAVMSAYPRSELMPALTAACGTGTTVYYDDEAHILSIITDFDDEMDPFIGVEAYRATDLATAQVMHEFFGGGIVSQWGADNTEELAGMDELVGIYVDGQVAALRERGVEPERFDYEINSALFSEIGRLQERLALLESVRVRHLRRALARKATIEDKERFLKTLYLTTEEVEEMLIDDHRRFGTIT
jgi:hypothetical protein